MLERVYSQGEKSVLNITWILAEKGNPTPNREAMRNASCNTLPFYLLALKPVFLHAG